MEKINLPNSIGIIALRVKKIKRNEALLTTLDGGLEFALPLNILLPEIQEGEKINLKIFNEIARQEDHEAFARKLLQGIIN